jgi:hypothetical protein
MLAGGVMGPPCSTPQCAFYRGADKSLPQPNSRCILIDGEDISFDASLVIYIYIYIYRERERERERGRERARDRERERELIFLQL